MEERTVHIIVLNWNGAEVIAPCLESLMRVERPDLRIIVVDNASTDSSADMVRERFPGVELIVNESNLLFAGGNNVGLRRAFEGGAEFMLLLNNDTEVHEDFAVRMLEVMDAHPEVGIVGPKIFYHDDPSRIWYGGGSFYPLIWIPRHLNIRRLEGEFEDMPGETGYVSGCAMLIRRGVIEDIGFLDPSYEIYCEDVDFCLRARRAGWMCYYEPRSRVWHKVSSSSGGGFTPFKLENRIRSTSMLFSNFRSVWWRVSRFPFHLAGFLALLAGLLLTGRWELLRGALRGAARVMRGG